MSIRRILKTVIILFLLSTIFLLFKISERNKKRSEMEKQIGPMISQMIMVGFRDEDLDSMLKRNKAGGYILFAQDYLTGKNRNLYNLENAKKIISKLQEHQIELIAVDNEGGPVNRLEKIDDFGKMESVLEMAKYTNSERIIKYKYYSKKMADLGITVDFAPVIDLQMNKDPNFFMNVRKRLFSDNPRQVSDLALDFIQSAKENKIITSFKHFPGHGSATGNTHEGFVDITKTWSEIELEPYKILLGNKNSELTTVMVAHVFNRNIDDEYPASMSYKTIDNYLRKILNFKGVVVSDAIDMKALSAKYSLEEILVNSINAGVNLIVHGNQIVYDKNIDEKIYYTILDAVIAGKINKEKIINSSNLIRELINLRKSY